MKKDFCDNQNISARLPCVYVCLPSGDLFCLFLFLCLLGNITEIYETKCNVSRVTLDLHGKGGDKKLKKANNKQKNTISEETLLHYIYQMKKLSIKFNL